MGLNTTVYVVINGEPTAFGPDSDVPEAIARQIGAHCFDNGEHPFPESADSDGDGAPDREFGVEPARHGKGATRDAWVAFAGEKGFEVPADVKTRDGLIEALIAADVIK